MVDLKGDKGDGAEDIDVVNTSELPNLELLNNQKEINEYLEQNKLDVAGGVMTGPLTILDSNTDVLFTTVNDGIEVTGPFSIKTGLFSVQDTNDNFLIDIADGFTSFYGDVQFGTSNALLATNSAQEIISYKSVELANLNSYVAGVRETNANNNLSFWKGTQAEYNNIPTKDPNTIYFVT